MDTVSPRPLHVLLGLVHHRRSLKSLWWKNIVFVPLNQLWARSASRSRPSFSLGNIGLGVGKQTGYIPNGKRAWEAKALAHRPDALWWLPSVCHAQSFLSPHTQAEQRLADPCAGHRQRWRAYGPESRLHEFTYLGATTVVADECLPMKTHRVYKMLAEVAREIWQDWKKTRRVPQEAFNGFAYALK